MSDSIRVEEVILQENDIVRNKVGLFLGRLDRDGKLDKLQEELTRTKEENVTLKAFIISQKDLPKEIGELIEDNFMELLEP